MTETKQPNRLIIKDLIEAGGATKESLLAEVGCSAASLATNFTYLRLMGFYPVKGEDETFSFITEEEWNELQAERKANAGTRKTATPKTPEELLEQAEKRYDRCEKALSTAETKDQEFGNEITELRLTIARAEFRLAELVLKDATDNMPVPVGEDEPDTDEPDVADDDLV